MRQPASHPASQQRKPFSARQTQARIGSFERDRRIVKCPYALNRLPSEAPLLFKTNTSGEGHQPAAGRQFPDLVARNKPPSLCATRRSPIAGHHESCGSRRIITVALSISLSLSLSQPSSDAHLPLPNYLHFRACQLLWQLNGCQPVVLKHARDSNTNDTLG